MRPTLWQRTQIRSKGTEKDISCIGNKRKSETAILNIRQNRFKNKAKEKDKGHHIMVEGAIQEDIILVHIHAPNPGASKYIKHILTDIRASLVVQW